MIELENDLYRSGQLGVFGVQQHAKNTHVTNYRKDTN